MIRVICADISSLNETDYLKLYAQSSGERKAKADRYRRREDALRCVAADALLRYALGTSAYTVERTELGKPYIKGMESFHFNLSHAGNWVVLAWGGSEVGVDVEQLRRETDTDSITRRYFAPEEQRYVREAEENRLQHFYEIWTGKESYLKYLGTGLQKVLTSFSVFSLEPEVRLHHRKLDEDHWLCLCSTENDCLLELLDLQRLIKGEM